MVLITKLCKALPRHSQTQYYIELPVSLVTTESSTATGHCHGPQSRPTESRQRCIHLFLQLHDSGPSNYLSLRPSSYARSLLCGKKNHLESSAIATLSIATLPRSLDTPHLPNAPKMTNKISASYHRVARRVLSQVHCGSFHHTFGSSCGATQHL
jgi:hypothetical protein